MGKRFDYLDYAKELRKDRDLVQRAVATIRRTVKLHGPRAVQTEISDAPRPPVDRGTYRRSWRFDDIPAGATMYNFSLYGSVIEDGRRPGTKAPPIAVIEEWVRRKGIGVQMGPVGFRKTSRGPGKDKQGPRQQITVGRQGKLDDSQVRGIAFVIARAIKRRGIPGLHILRLASEVVDEQIRRDLAVLLGGRRT